jgi:hypothetical protein
MSKEIRNYLNIPGARRALAQGDYTHRHNKVANIIHQELAIKCGLSKGPSIPYYKYEPQSVLENSKYKLYCDRSIITYRTIHNFRPDIVMLDKSSKKHT